ncbi:MAG: hypothetical protein AAGJ79_10070 [Verrucomicrobiota bacterium]
MTKPLFRLAFAGACLGISGLIPAVPSYERDPINYSDAVPETPVTRIANRIEQGEDLLTGESDREILGKFLTLLDIPVESQTLVYSQTSAQPNGITPETPRAVYFSDNAYVGWVRGGNIEITSFDRKLGAVFHMIHLDIRKPGHQPDIIRHTSCLDCHGGTRTRGYPGLVARSVYPSESGRPLLQAGTFDVDHSTPIANRWGGWFVTGDTGDHSHLGNLVAAENEDHEVTFKKVTAEPIHDLGELIDCTPYPGGGSSDVVALMILEHQISAQNAMVRANLITRQTLHRHREMRKALREPEDSPLDDSYQNILDGQAEKVVRELLFTDEFIMESGGPEGADSFQNAFSLNARRNGEGRSLKDLRLYERLFKYRCSYTIYSEPFRHLPHEIKSRILQRLRSILTAESAPEDYAYLSDSERERINEILRDTLPAYKTGS